MQSDFRHELAGLLPRLMRFAIALTRSREAAEDLVQAACERALARVGQWQPDTRLDSWMFRIIQTVWLNQVRARAVGERYRAAIAARAWEAVPPDAEGRLMLSQVAAKVMELPEEQRVVLLLVCVEGFSYREAADIAGIPIGTVMSRLARARLALMKAMGEPAGGDRAAGDSAGGDTGAAPAGNVIRMGVKWQG